MVATRASMSLQAAVQEHLKVCAAATHTGPAAALSMVNFLHLHPLARVHTVKNISLRGNKTCTCVPCWLRVHVDACASKVEHLVWVPES